MNWFQAAGSVVISGILATAGMAAGPAEYVISISVDGMGSSYMQGLIDSDQLPNMKRIQAEGAGTNSARNDFDFTVTLPNHTTMVTSRPVLGTAGDGEKIASHNWTGNGDPGAGQTLATNKGAYIASVFDVAHDNGLRTGMWASKSKFSLFVTSYDATNGQPDVTGADNGKNKVDLSFISGNTAEMTTNFITAMADDARRVNYAFVHITDPDGAGHGSGWGSEGFNKALIKADTQIGRILDVVDLTPALKGKTVIILTADHGGAGRDHSNNKLALDYTIPFYVWGAGVVHGDLYAMNAGTRLAPATGLEQSDGASLDRPDYAAAVQPVRNSEVGNLSLQLLGLPAIPGSSINTRQDLNVSTTQPASRPAAVEVGAGAGEGAGAFEIIVLPDTQRYVEKETPNLLDAQTQWIVDNKAAENIVFVTHEGDLVQEGGMTVQWDRANTAMSKLDGVVPYGIAWGNHDLKDNGAVHCISYFGDKSRHFAGKEWYGGVSPDGISSYQTFSGGGFNFINLAIRKDGVDDAATVEWAKGVLSGNPNKLVILTTHDYLVPSGAGSQPSGDDGRLLYTNLVQPYANVIMTLNGHTGAERHQVATNAAGGKVASMLADYQNIVNGGDGYLRKIRFDPKAGRIDVSTYSPTSTTANLVGPNSKFSYTAKFDAGANSIVVTGLQEAAKAAVAAPVVQTIVPKGSTGWHYLVPPAAADPAVGATFMCTDFVEADWAAATTAAPLGYGQADRAGLIQTAITDPGSGNRHTAYFRKTFSVADKAAFSSLAIELCRDDGAIVYLNGTELKRENMPAGAVTFTTAASAAVGGDDEAAYISYTGLNNLLVDGENLIAVEIHQSSATSSDLSFDMSLGGTPVAKAATSAPVSSPDAMGSR